MKWCPRRSPAGFAHSSAETPSPSCAGSSTCEVAPCAEERISAAADRVRPARRPRRRRLAPARARPRRRQGTAVSDLRARPRPRAPAHGGGDRHERVRAAQAQRRAHEPLRRAAEPPPGGDRHPKVPHALCGAAPRPRRGRRARRGHVPLLHREESADHGGRRAPALLLHIRRQRHARRLRPLGGAGGAGHHALPLQQGDQRAWGAQPEEPGGGARLVRPVLLDRRPDRPGRGLGELRSIRLAQAPGREVRDRARLAAAPLRGGPGAGGGDAAAARSELHPLGGGGRELRVHPRPQRLRHAETSLTARAVTGDAPRMLTLLLASVFLNGVNIDGLRSQKFDKCRTVRMAERADGHLADPGYQVEHPPAAVPASTSSPALAPLLPSAVAAAMTKRYWLVTEEKDGAAAQYDVDVFVNAKFVRKIRAGEPQVVLEITRYLHPGVNKVLFAATKRPDGGRKSASPASFLKMVVGEGDSGGNTVTMDNPRTEPKRTAAEP